jgi:hypothetical protein
LITMILLVTTLALRSMERLSRRLVASAAVAAMVLSALGAVSQLVYTHG